MRLAILTIWLLTPLSAHADPATFAAFIAWASTVAGAITLAQIALTIGTMIYGTAQAKKDARKARDEFNAGLQDRTATVASPDQPYRYVFGTARVGSSIQAILTSGGKDEFKHLVCVHAAHECTEFLEIYIAGKALGPLDADGFVTSGDYFTGTTEAFTGSSITGTYVMPLTPTGEIKVYLPVISNSVGDEGGYIPATTYVEIPFSRSGSALTFSNPESLAAQISFQYLNGTPRVRVQKHLGTPTDPADPVLMNYCPGQWTATDVLRGFTYTIVTLDINQPEFAGGIPSVEALLKGAKLYDLRTGLTAWSENPALVLYAYLTGEVCNIDAADLPAADFIAAANVCDEAVSFPDGSFAARYTFNGAITADQAPGPVLEKIAQSMAGGIVSTTWSTWAGKYVAPVLALDQSDIVGAFALTPGASDADKFNGVKGQFISPENLYVATDFQPYQNATYLAADGDERWTNIDFPYTTTTQRAWNLSRIFTEDQRNGYTVKATFSLKAWGIKPGQRVTLTSTVFGWSAKVFRVTDKSYSPTSMVELTLKEDTASIWDMADAVVLDDTPNTDLPNPFAVAPLTGLHEPQSGTDILLLQSDGTIVSRILVSWAAINASNTSIDLEWSVMASDVWQRMSVSGNETQAYISPVQDGTIYLIRARTNKPSVGAVSDWLYVVHQVIGKSTPPPDMSNLSIAGSVLNWTPIIGVTDLAGYVFRFHYGNNEDWGSAVPLHQGVRTESPFDLVTRPGGLVTVMGKAIDTSGNESLAAAVIVMNLGDPEIANIVETIDLQATGFPGSYSGCSVISGVLTAGALDSAYGTDDQSFYGADISSFYEPSAYAQMVFASNELLVSGALVGSAMTILIDYLGTDLFIEYRLTGPGYAYGADFDSAYGADDDSFYDGAGVWIPWPGQIIAANDVYQFRVTIGAGTTQGKILGLQVIIDAPDIVEYIDNIVLASTGTAIPHTKPFTVIKAISATLQANASSAVTVEINKSVNLAPTAKAYNASHAAVSGASVDFILSGY